MIPRPLRARADLPFPVPWLTRTGEALCRQFLYGQRYFKSRFGSYCKTHWLPDTLCVINRSDGAETTSGYSPQLPQLVRLAGMDYFFTQVSSRLLHSFCVVWHLAYEAEQPITRKLTITPEAQLVAIQRLCAMMPAGRADLAQSR